MNHINQFSALCNQHPAATQVFKFLQEMPFQRANDPKQGTTWLELYIVYRLAGHAEPISRAGNVAATKPSMGSQLREFRLIVRKIVKWTIGGKAINLFRGTEAKHQLLRSLGLRTVIATLPMQLNITAEISTIVAIHVVRAQANRSFNQAKAIVQEQQRIQLQPFRTKGKASWSEGIRPYKGTIYRPDDSRRDQDLQAGSCSKRKTIMEVDVQQEGASASSSSPATPLKGNLPPPQMIFLYCPKCLFAVDGTRAAFTTNKLDHKTWCKRCHRSWAVQNWQCSCHMPWHACPKHKMEPSRLRDDKESKQSRKVHEAAKRPLAAACTEEGANQLDQAGRQASNLHEEEIDLGPKRPKGRILPVLQAKYRRILQPGPSTEGKADAGETSREDRFGGGRPCVEPQAQARPDEAHPANPN